MCFVQKLSGEISVSADDSDKKSSIVKSPVESVVNKNTVASDDQSLAKNVPDAINSNTISSTQNLETSVDRASLDSLSSENDETNVLESQDIDSNKELFHILYNILNGDVLNPEKFSEQLKSVEKRLSELRKEVSEPSVENKKEQVKESVVLNKIEQDVRPLVESQKVKVKKAVVGNKSEFVKKTALGGKREKVVDESLVNTDKSGKKLKLKSSTEDKIDSGKKIKMDIKNDTGIKLLNSSLVVTEKIESDKKASNQEKNEEVVTESLVENKNLQVNGQDNSLVNTQKIAAFGKTSPENSPDSKFEPSDEDLVKADDVARVLEKGIFSSAMSKIYSSVFGGN